MMLPMVYRQHCPGRDIKCRSAVPSHPYAPLRTRVPTPGVQALLMGSALVSVPSCKERKGRQPAAWNEPRLNSAGLGSAPPPFSFHHARGCSPWSQQAPPSQPAPACCPASCWPPPPTHHPPGSLPLPQGWLSAGPQLGQRVSGAGQADRLFPGELRPVGSGQEGLVPRQRLKEGAGRGPFAQPQGELGCNTVGGLGLGNQEEGPGGCGRFMSVFGSRISASSAKPGPWPVVGESFRALGTPLPQSRLKCPSPLFLGRTLFSMGDLLLLSHFLRIWGSCCRGGANRCLWGS